MVVAGCTHGCVQALSRVTSHAATLRALAARMVELVPVVAAVPAVGAPAVVGAHESNASQ